MIPAKSWKMSSGNQSCQLQTDCMSGRMLSDLYRKAIFRWQGPTIALLEETDLKGI
ncbi:hypothetical protein PsAD14_03682 [Pseudovibrio sp. Ad14]|nr:hypothetical protein PsW74_03851 [Pseudovibrio sp. W74]KZL07299.1 hypothetical protein PsAD14_03682 [Pseudovibrio sp. Ad14]